MNVGAATIYAFTALNAEKYLATIAKYKINSFCAPPTLWRAPLWDWIWANMISVPSSIPSAQASR
ncbi:MAG: hypothetical protein R2941_03055 [Desulfobacterales bacterium]